MRESISKSGQGRYKTLEQISKIKPDSECVQLEIPIKVLQRLMAGRSLLPEDMHCLNRDSQQRVKRLLMDYMMGKS